MALPDRLRSSRLLRAGVNAREIAVAHRGAALRHPVAVVRFLLTTPELSNWTYDLENRDELLALAGPAVGVEASALRAYADELEQDLVLRDRLRAQLGPRRDRRSEPRYGKRSIQYALVRALGPRHVAETGTHDGLGAVVIAAALRRNAAEGRPGRLSTFDLNPEAGWLLGDPERELVRRHEGPTSRTLAAGLEDGVDLLIHDSLRTPDNERAEYATALAAARGPQLVIYCDDVRSTDALAELCRERSLALCRLPERPRRHWWPGNVLGLVLVPLQAQAGGADTVRDA